MEGSKEHKVLILKTGYSEVLDDRNDSRTVSLGDVLRTTPILSLHKNNHVTWVTDIKARPLLEGNKFIDRLLNFDFITYSQLESEEFDTLINLEKIPGICALTDRISAWKKYGFRFNKRIGEAEAYDKAFDVLAVGANTEIKKQNEKTAQELLFAMVGEKWNGEPYVLGYKPKTTEIYDVLLNTTVGSKWPTKAWPIKNWDALEKKLIEDGYSVTRQDKQDNHILTDLNNYMDWLNSGKIIVSNDSLGLHLGIALKKPVLGIFGPTPDKEVFFYDRGKSILPEGEFDCLPCVKGTCENKKYCLEQITPERIYKEVINIKNA